MSPNGQLIKPSFGRHEKFVFRHVWLKKGVDAVTQDQNIFSSDDALVVLGVGKNMVRSIRHWCLATSLIEEERSGRATIITPSVFGLRMFRDGGWDPFLEDTGTLWLLHWQLVSNQHRSLIWHIAFSRFYETEFSKKQLAIFIEKQLDRMGAATTSGMIDREIDCFLRTYIPNTREKADAISEESLDCPLAELDLIRFAREDNLYRFITGPKVTLPLEIFGYGLINFLATRTPNRRTFHIDECIYGEGSPGQVFRLDENSVVRFLEQLEELTEGMLRLQETAGLAQLYLDETFDEARSEMTDQLLERYYEQ